MYLIYHFIFSIILSGFLWPILGWGLVLFWLGSFFIDVDHYWWSILKFKSLDFKKAYDYHKYNHTDNKLHIFHIIEFWVLMGIWSIFSKLAFIIFLGLIFHIVLDLVDMIAKKIWYARTFSFFSWYYSS